MAKKIEAKTRATPKIHPTTMPAFAPPLNPPFATSFLPPVAEAVAWPAAMLVGTEELDVLAGTNSSAVTLKHGTWVVNDTASTNIFVPS
jgi:hypothetical protein